MTLGSFLVAVVSLASATINQSAPSTVLLGVLEELPVGVQQEPGAIHVRVAFQKAGERWEAFLDGFVEDHPLVFEEERYQRDYDTLWNQLPRTATWDVCFNGHTLAKLQSVLPPTWSSMALRGTHFVTEKQKIPRVGRKTKEFSGWIDLPVNRPLALVAFGRCSDPDAWRPRPLPRTLASALPTKLREAVTSVKKCEADGQAVLCDLRHRTWRLGRSYGSNRGNWLVLAVAEEREEAPLPILFQVSASGQARALGLDMRVVDVGDWDGDGHSELLVKFERYNHDGYTLFYGRNFEENATFGWMYH